MRVWLTRAYEALPTIDRTGRYMRYGLLARALTERGHSVIWWTSNFDHARKQHRFQVIPELIEIWPGVSLKLLPGPRYRRNVCLSRVWHNISIARAFERQANHCNEKPDIVVACVPTLELAEKAVLYGLAKRIPIVVDVEDEWPDIYLISFPSQFRRLARFLLRSEFHRAKRIFRSASAVIACSNTYLRWALNYAGRPKVDSDAVFYSGYSKPGVEMEEESKELAAQMQSDHGIRSDLFVATFLGQFGASYDLETVIKAARMMQAEGERRVQFVLGGDGDKNAKLRNAAHGLPNVIFTGWLGAHAMVTLLRLSSVGLAAYSDLALQSMPYKPFEYMAAGLPIISSLRGELEMLLDEKGIGKQYKAGDAASLAGCVRWFLDHSEECRQMGMRVRQLFEEQFAADLIYPRMVEYLEKRAAK